MMGVFLNFKSLGLLFCQLRRKNKINFIENLQCAAPLFKCSRFFVIFLLRNSEYDPSQFQNYYISYQKLLMIVMIGPINSFGQNRVYVQKITKKKLKAHIMGNPNSFLVSFRI